MASLNATIISVDLPDGDFDRRLGPGFSDAETFKLQQYTRPGQKLHLLRIDSHELAARLTIESLLAGRQVDLLFIDGDHSYAGVRQDFETYGALVRGGGVVALHDVLPQYGHA